MANDSGDGPVTVATPARRYCCPRCGYDLYGLADGTQCPECGFGFERAALDEIADVADRDAADSNWAAAFWLLGAIGCNFAFWGELLAAGRPWYESLRFALPFAAVGFLIPVAVAGFVALARRTSPWIAFPLAAIGYLIGAFSIMHPRVARLAASGCVLAAYFALRRHAELGFDTALARAREWPRVRSRRAAETVFVIVFIWTLFSWIAPP